MICFFSENAKSDMSGTTLVRDRRERFLPEMAKILEKCVWVTENENGTISMENEDAEWIVVSLDQNSEGPQEQ